MRYQGLEVGIAFVAMLGVAADEAAAGASGPLRLSSPSAVPGQAISFSAPGLRAGRVKVFVGGKRARTGRVKRRPYFVVPRLRPGRATVSVRSRTVRRTGRLRIRRGFSGRVRPRVDAGRGSAGEVTRDGLVVAATGADGTLYELTLPPGAAPPGTRITVAPLRGLGGLTFTRAPVLGVQFGPDGLRLARPGTLRITPRRPLRNAVALLYEGSGKDVAFAPARAEGGALIVQIEHFSGAGGVRVGPHEIVAALAYLATSGFTTDQDVFSFFTLAQLGTVFFGRGWCLTNPTCAAAFDLAVAWAEREAAARCRQTATMGPMAERISILHRVEAEEQLLGRPPSPRLEECRERLVAAMVELASGSVRGNPLAVSGACSDIEASRGDFSGDGVIREIECGLFVAGVAAEQGFERSSQAALADVEAGFSRALADGQAKCRVPTYHEGQDILRRGFEIAVGRPREPEFADALLACMPKIIVSPPSPSVVAGGTQAFEAVAEDPGEDPAVVWSAGSGQIDQAGRFTAPSAPGTVTVTATSATNPDRKGSATVTVVCPQGQVEFRGACATIAVEVSPEAVTLEPGELARFSATVANASDPRVSWGTSGGTVTQPSAVDAGGLYTAPEAPGTYTVTAVSVQDPTKSASATVTVEGGPLVELLGRESELVGLAHVSCPMASGGHDQFHDDGPGLGDFSGPFSLQGSVEAQAVCGSTEGSAGLDSDLSAGGAGATVMFLETRYLGSATLSDPEGSAFNHFDSALRVAVRPVGDAASLSCDASVTGAGGVVVRVGSDPAFLRLDGQGSDSGAVTIPEDDRVQVQIISRLGKVSAGAGGGSASITCEFNRTTVVVPD